MKTISKTMRKANLFKGLDFLPHFTLAVLVAIAAPTIMCLHLGAQQSVKYWVGSLHYLAWFAPLFVLMCHMLHLFYGRPRYILMCLTLFVPSTMLCMIGNSLPIPVALQLLSPDCTTFADKYHIQEAYIAARSIYNECIQDVIASSNQTMMQAQMSHTLEDCPNYKPAESNFFLEWQYLELLEKTQDCRGWCYEEDASLWVVNTRPRDTCSKEVGMVTQGTIAMAINFVLFNGGLGAIASLGAVYAYEHIFQVYGIDW